MAQRMWFNGRPAALADVAPLLATNYGHFTAMPVRGGRAQGLQLHLRRLQEATRALFASELDLGEIREWLRRAIGETDAAVRISVYSRAFDRDRPLLAVPADVLIAVAPPRQHERRPLRVCSIPLARATPAIKDLGSHALFHARRLAQSRGFDDALLVDASGVIAEGSIWNVGFADAGGIIWPAAPALDGIGRQLLEAGLAELGVAQSVRRVELAEVGRFDGAFFTNSMRGAVPLTGVDEAGFMPNPALCALLDRALAIQPWERP